MHESDRAREIRNDAILYQDHENVVKNPERSSTLTSAKSGNIYYFFPIFFLSLVSWILIISSVHLLVGKCAAC